MCAGPIIGTMLAAQPHVRVSDAERELALAAFAMASPTGRLTHETFSHRVDEVLRARANGELRSAGR